MDGCRGVGTAGYQYPIRDTGEVSCKGHQSWLVGGAPVSLRERIVSVGPLGSASSVRCKEDRARSVSGCFELCVGYWGWAENMRLGFFACAEQSREEGGWRLRGLVSAAVSRVYCEIGSITSSSSSSSFTEWREAALELGVLSCVRLVAFSLSSFEPRLPCPLQMITSTSSGIYGISLKPPGAR